jgi:hypothetical protein
MTTIASKNKNQFHLLRRHIFKKSIRKEIEMIALR